MKLYNTASKSLEEFKPIKKGSVGVYSCGPTVYWNQHIGHMYAYVQWDVLVRYLRYKGFKVKWVMNITDVGHMTSDEDIGEDKMEKGAKREGISVWQIADRYIAQFKDSIKLLNIIEPDILSRATEHIEEQIDLAKKIENNGFAYKTKMGLVYDTSKFSSYTKFANLKLDKQKKREDVQDDSEKKAPWDFFLWAIDPKHIMKWKSPWGEGYPGWHLECTAMSTKYLGNRFDIHTGGIDHLPVHHTNEIAQGHAAFGSSTANYWLHNGMLGGAGGEKMSKSLDNFLTIQDLKKKRYDPLSLRYLILSSHYRKGLSFSFEALDSAQKGLQNLRKQVVGLKGTDRSSLSKEKREKIDALREKFENAMENDLNTPRALAVVSESLKSYIPTQDKYDLILNFDEVLGLKLGSVAKELKIPKNVLKLVGEREKERARGDFEKSDKIRTQIEDLGYTVLDTKKGSKVTNK